MPDNTWQEIARARRADIRPKCGGGNGLVLDVQGVPHDGQPPALLRIWAVQHAGPNPAAATGVCRRWGRLATMAQHAPTPRRLGEARANLSADPHEVGQKGAGKADPRPEARVAQESDQHRSELLPPARFSMIDL